jgi:hypothetical protein
MDALVVSIPYFVKYPNLVRLMRRIPDGLQSVFLSIAKLAGFADCRVWKNAAAMARPLALLLTFRTQGKRTGHESLALPVTLFVPAGLDAISPTGCAGRYCGALPSGLNGGEAETAGPGLLTPASQNDTSPRRHRQKGHFGLGGGAAERAQTCKTRRCDGCAGLEEVSKAMSGPDRCRS